MSLSSYSANVSFGGCLSRGALGRLGPLLQPTVKVSCAASPSQYQYHPR